MRTISPLRALGAGLVAGVLGSLAQSLFFRATRRLADSLPPGHFSPPEPAQNGETETQTVARRIANGIAQRPLDWSKKELGGQLVHLAFGGAWGGLYGLTVSSLPAFPTPIAIPAFSVLVWGVSDNVLLPAFQLAGPPTAYPAQRHAYAIAAHLVYGTVVGAVFAAMQPARPKSLPLAAWTNLLAASAGASHALRRPARRVFDWVRATGGIGALRRVVRFAAG